MANRNRRPPPKLTPASRSGRGRLLSVLRDYYGVVFFVLGALGALTWQVLHWMGYIHAHHVHH